MKSALELAMEKADSLSGGAPDALSDKQKKEIADIRAHAESQIAQEKIMLDDKIAKGAGRPEMAAAIDEARERFCHEREKTEERAERQIAKIKGA